MRRTDPISGYSYNTRGSGRAKWIILLVLILAVVAAALLIFQPWAGDEEKPSGGGLIIDPNAGDYVKPTQTQPTIIPSVAVPGWSSITIPANQQTVSVDFYNPEANEGMYYLTFKLILSDTGEVLYESAAVPPGKHIQTIKLTRALSAGTYDAVVHVQPYRMSDETPANNADMKTKLIVK